MHRARRYLGSCPSKSIRYACSSNFKTRRHPARPNLVPLGGCVTGGGEDASDSFPNCAFEIVVSCAIPAFICLYIRIHDVNIHRTLIFRSKRDKEHRARRNVCCLDFIDIEIGLPGYMYG